MAAQRAPPARHLHATGVFAAISGTSLQAARKTMEVMRAAGHSISFDPNLRPSLWATPEHMRTSMPVTALPPA